MVHSGKNAVSLIEHDLQDFILGEFSEVFGIVVAVKSFNDTPGNGDDVDTVRVQVQP